MCNNPDSNDRVIEALEACRPGSDDAASPELQLDEILAADAGLRERFERLQRAESRLCEAFGDVPVPAGLEQRILARLAGETKASPERKGPWLRRRWWLAASAAAAVAASLFAAFWIGLPSTHPRDEAGVLDAVLQRFALEVESDLPPGLLVAENEPPARFPMSRAVARVPDLRWRVVRGLLGQRAVAYDFPDGGGRGATLYVLPAEDAEVARTRPPANPIQSTGGFCASVWKEGDRLYVLVVRGDARAYRRLIYAPSGPLT